MRRKSFGPYATNLRQVLIRMEKHYTQGYGDGKDKPTQPIEVLPGAEREAEKFLARDETYSDADEQGRGVD